MRAIAARVSIYAETSATFTAKPKAQPPEDGFALLKALCFAVERRLSEQNGLAPGTVPYIREDFYKGRALDRITKSAQGLEFFA